MLDVNAKNDKLLSEVSDLKQDNQVLKHNNQEIQQKLDNHKQILDVVAENVTQMSENMFINQTKSEKTIKKGLPENFISTKSTREVFILINKPSLTDEIYSDYEGLSINDVVLDSISCQLRDREQNLKNLKYKRS